MAVVAKCSRRGFSLLSPPRSALGIPADSLAGGEMFVWSASRAETLRPKEENTTRHDRNTNSTMKLFCPTCEMTRLDSQIQELTETLAQIDARSNRLLVAMESDGLAVVGDVHD